MRHFGGHFEFSCMWRPFWIFKNDENVFFVPKNVRIDTSITITGSIQCHILIWSKSVILAAILNFRAHGSHFGLWKLLYSKCHGWKHINTHQNYQNRPQDTEKRISTPKIGALPEKVLWAPFFFQKTAGGIVFPRKFQSRNNFKHKVNTLSHPFVSERLTSSTTLCGLVRSKRLCATERCFADLARKQRVSDLYKSRWKSWRLTNHSARIVMLEVQNGFWLANL